MKCFLKQNSIKVSHFVECLSHMAYGCGRIQFLIVHSNVDEEGSLFVVCDVTIYYFFKDVEIKTYLPLIYNTLI